MPENDNQHPDIKLTLTEFGRGYKEGLKEASESLQKRIVALEILLQQKDMRVRHLEEQLKERGATIRIKKEPINPKDEQ